METAADGFAPHQVGKALASFWMLNGLTMKAERKDIKTAICPFTIDTITNPGMTADGFVYQLGFIMDWLGRPDSRGRSPMMNKDLDHTRILT